MRIKRIKTLFISAVLMLFGSFVFGQNCDVEANTLTGGPFNFCVGDGVSDFIASGDIISDVNNTAGDDNFWIVTDDQGVILGLPAMPSDVDFDATAAGTCFIQQINYTGTLTGVTVGENTANIVGCRALSNSITVNRTVCAALDSSIPTMGEWGLMSLTILLAIFGIVAIRERQLAFE